MSNPIFLLFACLFLPIILFVLLIGTVASHDLHHHTKRRAENFHKLADTLAFDFKPEGDPKLLPPVDIPQEALVIFSQGNSKRIYNLLQGRIHDVDIAIYDYEYGIPASKNKELYNQTIIEFRSNCAHLPNFNLQPVHALQKKIEAWLVSKDINFADDPLFSSRYSLQGHDEAMIRKLFGAKVRQHYTQQWSFSTECYQQRLLFYQERQQFNSVEASKFLYKALDILGLFEEASHTTDNPKADF